MARSRSLSLRRSDPLPKPRGPPSRNRRSANRHHPRWRDLRVIFQVSGSAIADVTPRTDVPTKRFTTDPTNRHPRLDPGSRFLGDVGEGSGIPDQVRGDEKMNVKLMRKRLSLTFHVSELTRQEPRRNIVRWCDLSVIFRDLRRIRPVAAPCVCMTLAGPSTAHGATATSRHRALA